MLAVEAPGLGLSVCSWNVCPSTVGRRPGSVSRCGLVSRPQRWSLSRTAPGYQCDAGLEAVYGSYRDNLHIERVSYTRTARCHFGRSSSVRLGVHQHAFWSQLLASPHCFLSCPHSLFCNRPLDRRHFLKVSHQDNPVDVEVPKDTFDATVDAQPSPTSNTGSPYSSNSDSVMCPPPAAGGGLLAGSSAGPIASFEFLAREMAAQFAQLNEQFSILQSSMADMERQLRELTVTTVRRNGCVPSKRVRMILTKFLREPHLPAICHLVHRTHHHSCPASRHMRLASGRK